MNGVMTETEKAIHTSLVELEAMIQSMRSEGTKPDLMSVFERIESLTRQLPKETDSALLHYLHKKSYQKARLWLEGRESENAAGNCGHV